jgi:predicted enzyme related to lactoylglutathione lyase
MTILNLVVSLAGNTTGKINSTKMKKTALIILSIATSFCFGFAFNTMLTNQANNQTEVGRATGIGGIFFKCKDPKKMREWYQTHLGLNTNQYGAVFEWHQGADSTKKGFTTWSPFKETTKYFEPSTKDFMINYRVENLEALVEQLKKDSVTVTDKIETVEYGKFVHVLDVEGNKVELWEPNDIEYDKMGKQMGAKTTK